MAQPGAPLKLLLICPWIVKLARLQQSLQAYDLAAQIVRVDFDAALRAAAMHHHFDAAFYTPTPSLSRDVAVAMLREHAPKLVLVEVDTLEQIAPRLAALLAARRS